MTKQVQRRRGTTSQHTSFTGAEGEISVNTSNKTVHVHDGSTAGGFEAALASLDNVSVADVSSALAGVTNIDINGGTIDGTVIGNNSAAAITGTTVTGTSFVSSGNMSFGDNDKAVFGAGSDLQIYHDGSDNNSYIKENGAGSLYVDAANLILRTDTGENLAKFLQNGQVQLFNDNDQKLATTSTGVDVTGTITSDGLTVETTSNTAASFYDDNNGTIKVGNNTAVAGNTASLYLNHNSLDGVRITSEAKESFADAGSRTADLAISTRHNGNLYKRMDIASNGDISFYEDTGTTPKFFWDASTERLGIGNSSPTTALDVTGTITSDGLSVASASSGVNTTLGSNAVGLDFSVGHTGNGTGTINLYPKSSPSTEADSLSLQLGGTTFFKMEDGGDISFYEDTGTTAKFFWDASAESLGIGTSSPDTLMEMVGTDAKLTIRDPSGSTATALATLRLAESGASDTLGSYWDITGKDTGWDLAFTHNSTGEAMRIDSSGILLVGKTAVESTTEGTYIGNGQISSVRAGTPAILNRLTSDGNILDLRKDGTTVGSIGSNASSHLTMGSGDTGILFNAATDKIHPWNMTTQGIRDNAVDLGVSVSRFKDLYLSGGVYLGGTGPANHLDDYEEGEYQVTVTASTSGSYTMRAGYTYYRYVKIGQVVHIQGMVSLSGASSPVGQPQINLPFTVGSGTNFSEWATGSALWWDNSGSAYTPKSIILTSGTTATVQMDAADLAGFDYIIVGFSYYTA
jgi:hypothetical protein